MAADNKLLGQFDLMGIPPAPRGVPQVEVTFDIDANGIVNVTAKDKATNKEQQIRIQASGGLSEADIDKMVKDAEAHAAEDKKRRELVESKNQGESLIHQTEKSVQEHGDKVQEADKQAIQTAIDALRQALAGEDAEVIKSRTTDLMQAFDEARAGDLRGVPGARGRRGRGSARSRTRGEEGRRHRRRLPGRSTRTRRSGRSSRRLDGRARPGHLVMRVPPCHWDPRAEPGDDAYQG
jgi:molecular chaperone DnaK